MKLAALVVAMVLVTPAASAADQSITAVGTGQAKVKPANRHRNASIERAVDRAYARAVPRAVAHAREDARTIAKASGLVLGAIESVDASASGAEGYYGPPANVGPFGPGQYCGKVTRRVHRRDAAGRLHTVTRTKRRCIVPELAFTTLAVTFAATSR